MLRNLALVALLVGVLLGCGSGPTHADDQKPDDKQPVPPRDDKKADDKKPAGGDDKKVEKAARKFVAEVTDRFGTAPFKIEEAQLLVPQVSLLGGESFNKDVKFTVKHGAAEIEVPFEDVAKVTFGEVKDDRLAIVIEFRAQDKADKTLDGTVKSNLQLGGKYQARALAAKLKLREIKSLTLEEAK